MIQLVPLALLASVGGSVDSAWSTFATPLIIIFGVGALGLLFRTGSNRYPKVPPEKALIIYGGGKTRVISGGAKWVWPLFEDYYMLELSVFQFDVPLNNAPNKDNVPINVKTSVTCKISNKEELLPVAAGAFGRKDMKLIATMVQGVIDGHIRVLIGKSSMETVLRDQDTFKESIQKEVTQELAKLGCEVVVLNIQEVSDPGKVIEAMGKPEAARVKANAAIQEAEQSRRQTMETTKANMDAATTAAQNDALTAEANRNRDIKRAGFDAEVAKARATAEQAQPLATAEARKAVVLAEVEVQRTQTQAETSLQEEVAKKTQAVLNATVLKQAEAERQKQVIVATGAAEAAQQTKLAVQAEGEGNAAKTRAEGEAKADVTRSVGKAEADANKARLEAEADGHKAELLADAEGQKAMAEATKKMLDAYEGMTADQQKIFMVKLFMENASTIIKEFGDAGQKIMGEFARVTVAGIGQVDKITVYDSPSGQQDGALSRVLKLGPGVLLQTAQQLEASGMLPVIQGLLEKLGIDVAALSGNGPGSHLPVVAQAEVKPSAS